MMKQHYYLTYFFILCNLKALAQFDVSRVKLFFEFFVHFICISTFPRQPKMYKIWIGYSNNLE